MNEPPLIQHLESETKGPQCVSPPSDISLNHLYASHKSEFFISLTYYHCLFFFYFMSFIIPFRKVLSYCMDIMQLYLSPLYSKTCPDVMEDVEFCCICMCLPFNLLSD